jgi:hypothetical protein
MTGQNRPKNAAAGVVPQPDLRITCFRGPAALAALVFGPNIRYSSGVLAWFLGFLNAAFKKFVHRKSKSKREGPFLGRLMVMLVFKHMSA